MAEQPAWIQQLQQRDSQFTESYLAQRERILGEGAIPAKYKILMTMIVDPDGKGLADHWQKSAQALLVGVGLHVLYTEPNKTLADAIRGSSATPRTP